MILLFKTPYACCEWNLWNISLKVYWIGNLNDCSERLALVYLVRTNNRWGFRVGCWPERCSTLHWPVLMGLGFLTNSLCWKNKVQFFMLSGSSECEPVVMLLCQKQRFLSSIPCTKPAPNGAVVLLPQCAFSLNKHSIYSAWGSPSPHLRCAHISETFARLFCC